MIDGIFYFAPEPNTPEAREDFAKRGEQARVLLARRERLLAIIAEIDLRLMELAERSVAP